jgi:hypothetical protein
MGRGGKTHWSVVSSHSQAPVVLASDEVLEPKFAPLRMDFGGDSKADTASACFPKGSLGDVLGRAQALNRRLRLRMDPEASMSRFGVVILPYYCVITSVMCNPTLPGRATARNQRRTQGRLALPSEVARRASCRAETSALAGYGHFFACSRSAGTTVMPGGPAAFPVFNGGSDRHEMRVGHRGQCDVG